MALVFFSVRAKLAAVLADASTDSDYDPTLGSFSADVTFTPLIRSGDVVKVFDASPPTMYVPVPITAVVDSADGLLKLRTTADAGGAGTYAPLRLLGNSSSLDLEDGSSLYYSFKFSNIRIDGRPSTVVINPGAFEAPNSDTTIDLIDYMAATGQTAAGVNRIAPGAVRLDGGDIVFSFGGVDIADPIPFEPVFTSSEITDSTAVGRALLGAADALAARTTIGAMGVVTAAEATGTSSDITNLSAAVTSAHSTSKRLVVPAGEYQLDSALTLPGQFVFEGTGPGDTVLVPATGVDGVNTNSGGTSAQYSKVSGFAVEYADVQTRDDEAAAVDVPAGLQFSELSHLVVKNAHHGVRAVTGGGNNSEFNNLFHTIRALDCWRAFTFESGGSGSAHVNLYASAPHRPSIWQALKCSDFSGEFLRTNLEHATVRDCMMHLSFSHDVSFRGLHMEGGSFMSQGSTPLDGALAGAVIKTSGTGVQTIDNWTIDSCHFGAMIVTPSGLTRDGSTARATVNLMGMQQKVNGGHGFEVGDSIFIEGADAGTSSEYNGAHIVTGVGADWVEFTVSGTPASPAAVASGADCITVSLGDTVSYAQPLIWAQGNAGRIHIGNLHIRDTRVVGATASRRQNMLRLLRNSSTPVKLTVDRISFAGQRANHSWREPARIAGFSRSSNVATVHFTRPHNLAPDNVLHIYGATATSFNGVHSGGLTAVSPFAVSFPNTGSDQALVAEGTALALVRTSQIASVARTGNYATITTTADHGLYSTDAETGVGLRVAVRADDSTFDTADALILDVPSATTFVIRSVGDDKATTADAGSVMLIEGGLSTGALIDGSEPLGGLVQIGDMDEYATVVSPSSIASRDTLYTRTLNVQRADPARDMVQVVAVSNRDGRLSYYGEVVNTNQIAIKIANPTGAAITPPASVVHVRVVRGAVPTAPSSPSAGSGTVELGSTTDTTLSRAAAGKLAVAGVEVPTVSSTSTLTNKQLTAPKVDYLHDVTNNSATLRVLGAAGAVNYVQVYSHTTGNAPQIQANGTDENISLNLRTVGTGVVQANGSEVLTAAKRNQADGVCGLDAGGKVAAAQLPSYVDDVVEAANFAALPETGETGKIYTTVDTNKVYRWSGSAYVEISPSPGSTDSVTEGSTNLYFTNARADARITAWAGASPSLTTPALGTPTSGTLTNCTGLPVSGIAGSTGTALGVGSLELGHASDTTLTRSAAGKLAVEGVDVVLTGGALGTPTSGTLTNCTGLPVAGIAGSTATALGVGSLELGHASDTTITRTAAGIIAVEGSDISTVVDSGPNATELIGNAEAVFGRWLASSSATLSNGVMRIAFFTCRKSQTITSIRSTVTATAQAGATLCRIGLYTVDASDNMTLVASTTNDTALWSGASATATKALTTPYAVTRGTRYAIGMLVVGSSTAPVLAGAAQNIPAEAATVPRINGAYSGQTDLPNTVSVGSITATTVAPFAVMVP